MFFIAKAPMTEMYIINLDHRPERLELTTDLLYKAGFKNVKRYPAVNGKELTERELNSLCDKDALIPVKRGYRTEHHELSFGAIGCYLSHVNLWKDSNADILIIFEDDALPNFDINQMNEHMRYVPNDWDIILFGGIFNAKTDINEFIIKTKKFYCTHAYMINKKSASRLAAKAFPISKQIDSWLSDLALDDNINIYAFRKNPWIQNAKINATDIQIPIIENKK